MTVKQKIGSVSDDECLGPNRPQWEKVAQNHKANSEKDKVQDNLENAFAAIHVE
jgi:hypothetical protein